MNYPRANLLTLAVAKAVHPELFARLPLRRPPMQLLTPENQPRYDFVAREVHVKEPEMGNPKHKNALRSPMIDAALTQCWCLHTWANLNGPGVHALLVQDENNLLDIADLIDANAGFGDVNMNEHCFVTAATAIEAYLALEYRMVVLAKDPGAFQTTTPFYEAYTTREDALVAQELQRLKLKQAALQPPT